MIRTGHYDESTHSSQGSQSTVEYLGMPLQTVTTDEEGGPMCDEGIEDTTS